MKKRYWSNKTVKALCQRAKELELAGDYEAARSELGSLLTAVRNGSRFSHLTPTTLADLILRVGALSGWFGGIQQLPGEQEIAKALISESIDWYESVGDRQAVAEARVKIALCYWREGELDEARIILREALHDLQGCHIDVRGPAILTLSMIERSAVRYHTALNIITAESEAIELSQNHNLKGRFHYEYAGLLANVGRAEVRGDYQYRALRNYKAAALEFRRADNARFEARVETDLGSLFLTIDKLKEANRHLNRARVALNKLGDKGGVARVDHIRARVLIAEKRFARAADVANLAVKILEERNELGELAEVLTTHGISLARMGSYSLSQMALKRAMDISMQVGDFERCATATLTIIEELGNQIAISELGVLFERAADLLTHSQRPETLKRLVNCARRALGPRPMSLKRPLRVFLCHAKDDKSAIRELQKQLLAQNIDPWLDEDKLLAGQEWELEIAEAVRNSDAVIVCLSKKSIPKAGYVQKEIRYALDVADQQPEGAVFLIPLKLETCDVPQRLRSKQWLDYFKAGGFTQLLNALQHRAIELDLAVPPGLRLGT